VILHQLAHQLPAFDFKLGLQFGMLQAGGLGAIEETQRRLNSARLAAKRSSTPAAAVPVTAVPVTAAPAGRPAAR
jgi:hypothetical protein